MKIFFRFFITLSILAFTIPENIYAQCPAAGLNYPTGTFTPTTSWQILATDSWGGDYALFNVVSGSTYEWSFCTSDGGISTWDSQLTLYNEADTSTVLDYSDDACDGTSAKLQWVATFTGVVRVKISEFNCLDNTDNATLVYRTLGVVIPPANDACANAINLTVNSSCVLTNGTVSGASQSLIGCTGDANDDVWYKFTATSTASVVSVTGSVDFDAVLEVFSGSCGSLNSISCTDTSLEGESEAVTLLNLTIGNTYYVRVYDYYSFYPASLTFDICVYTAPTCNITSPLGAIAETETCGLDQNGGCNMTTPAYQPIGCGNTIYGTSWADGGSRDTDWYSFTTTSSGTVNIMANAEFPYQILLIDVSNCAAPTILEFAEGAQCTPLSISTTLNAGSYAAFISHLDFFGNPCGSQNNNYTLNLTYGIPASITASGPTSICAGGNVTLTATAGQSYLWTNGATTQSINVTTAGSYGVTVTYAGGCTSSATPVNVTVTTPTTTITPSGPTTFCTGGSVNLSATSGSSYSWSTGATTQSINVTNSGNYTVTVTYAGGCTSSAMQSITVNSAPASTITSSGSTTFCQGGSVNLTASAGQSYAWSTGATTQSITASTTGSYSVTVTYSGGCTSVSNPTSVTVNTAPTTTISPSGPTTFCTGGSVDLSASNGVSYLWSGGSTNQTINVTSSGNYTVTVTYANGCTSSATQNVSVNTVTNTTITPSGSTNICPGGSVTLTATSGTSYLWSGGQTTQSVNATSAGNYVVTVTYANGCTSSANLAVTVQTVPGTTITPSGPTTFCTGGSVTLTAGNGNSYLWSDGSTNQTLVANTTGNYVVTITYAGGCTGSASQSVTVNSPPATTITPSGSTTFCTGGSVNLTASTGTGYSWSNGNITQTINATSAGVYTVTVTYSNGCTSSASQSVTVNTAPVSTVTPSGPTTFCQGGSVNLSASSGNNYLWSGGQTTQDINVTASGNYVVTVTYSNGCTSSASQSVTVTPVPTTGITPSGPTTFCPGADVDLTATSGTAYMWSNGNTSQTINVNSSGTYIVTVTYSSGCTGTASVAVNVSTAPVTDITTSTGGSSICAGENITLTATAGTGYVWSTGATTQSIVVNTAGTFDVTVTYPGNCSSTSAPVTITVNTPPATTITPSGPTTFCEGGNVSLSASSGQSYLWSDGSTTQTLNANTSGTYTVTVTYPNGCTSSASSTITVDPAPAPVISASGSTTICLGDSLMLSSSAAQSYLWTGGATSQSITVTSAGTYTVTVTYANGCINTSSETIVVNTAPATTITASGPSTFCEGGSVDLTASAGQSYQWSNGSINQDVNIIASGTYTVTVTYVNGCTSSASTSVTVDPAPSPTISNSGSTTICQGDSVMLTSSSGQSYLWSNAETTQSIIVTTGGVYSVSVTYVNGCVNTSTPVMVTVNPPPATPVITASGIDLTSSAATGNLWYFNGNAIPGATAQNYTPTQNGNYTVEVTDANGCTSVSSAFTVTWVGISDIGLDGSISVYPNPASNQFSVELIDLNEDPESIFITNALGQVVKTEVLTPTNDKKWSFNVSGFMEGIYFVHLQFESTTIVTKIVVER